ncbi:MAG: hypothetical protein IT555_14800 [Acetobacteraceae bacterium]|nr:hypothetical protein [Acetobacteraceae bacterium]
MTPADFDRLAARTNLREVSLAMARRILVDGLSAAAAGREFGRPRDVASRAGLTAYDAAATAARYMIEYAQSNPDGGDLMAPADVLELVPEHLRSISARADD